jgi:SAM-dependent methyltransferase
VTRRRYALLSPLGIQPNVHALVRAALDEAIATAEARGTSVSVLDAGCGRRSDLRSFRPRLGRLVGADVHPPSPPLPYLDDFVLADLCTDADAFAPASFDIVLSSFVIEHFADPASALRNLHGWLKPGGSLVATTVNRRHPWVRTYLSLPDALRRRLQPLVKASIADAHPLVGACNDPLTIRSTLAGAGFSDIHLRTVGYLARAWGRRLPAFAIGLLGDVLAQPFPSRRSTIVIVARA